MAECSPFWTGFEKTEEVLDCPQEPENNYVPVVSVMAADGSEDYSYARALAANQPAPGYDFFPYSIPFGADNPYLQPINGQVLSGLEGALRWGLSGTGVGAVPEGAFLPTTLPVNYIKPDQGETSLSFYALTDFGSGVQGEFDGFFLSSVSGAWIDQAISDAINYGQDASGAGGVPEIIYLRVDVAVIQTLDDPVQDNYYVSEGSAFAQIRLAAGQDGAFLGFTSDLTTDFAASSAEVVGALISEITDLERGVSSQSYSSAVSSVGSGYGLPVSSPLPAAGAVVGIIPRDIVVGDPSVPGVPPNVFAILREVSLQDLELIIAGYHYRSFA